MDTSSFFEHHQQLVFSDPEICEVDTLNSIWRKRLNPKILLIDDNLVYSTVFRGYADSLNFEVQVVNNYKDLKFIDINSFDVVIMDYDLGSTNGRDLSDSIQAAIPFILISSNDLTYSSCNQGSKFWDFMHKSHGPEAILDAAFDAHESWKRLYNLNGKGAI